MKKTINIKISWLIGLILGVVILILSVIVAINKYKDNVWSEKYREETNVELSEISYEIPKEFEESDYIYSKNYSFYNGNYSCTVKISGERKENIIHRSDDLLNWLKKEIFIYLSDDVSETKELDINNTKSYNIDVKRDFSTESYYAFESSNYYYLLEYRLVDYLQGDRDNNEINICYSSKDKIISSIVLK